MNEVWMKSMDKRWKDEDTNEEYTYYDVVLKIRWMNVDEKFRVKRLR